MRKLSLLLSIVIPISSCAQIPSCALAKPEDGWHFISEAPLELKHHQWPGTSDNVEMVWVKNENGAYGQCSKRIDENYCFGLFEIYVDDPPVLITSEHNCES